MRLPLSLPALRLPRSSDAASLVIGGVASVASRIAAMWSVAGVENPYSRRVALLKRTLPTIGILLLLLIALWPRLTPLWERIRFPAIDLREARELRMLNPRYAGTDRLGRPYVVTAAVGHQVPDRQDLMSLERARADVKSHSGADIVVTADTAVYQSQAQLLDLFGNVTMTHENGTRFVTNTARLDIAHNAAQGDDPVEGRGPSGDIKSQGFRIYDKGDTVIFTGRSAAILKGAKMTAANSAKPPMVPPPVAATAARVEAQMKPPATHSGSHGAAHPAKSGTTPHAPAAKPAGAKPSGTKRS
jgi:lipopolysaccharide export system protein LptC